MPVGEIAGELLGGVIRIVGHFLLEVVFDVLIKGSGYLICRLFSKRVNPEGIVVILVGLLFWGIVGYSGFLLYDYIYRV